MFPIISRDVSAQVAQTATSIGVLTRSKHQDAGSWTSKQFQQLQEQHGNETSNRARTNRVSSNGEDARRYGANFGRSKRLKLGDDVVNREFTSGSGVVDSAAVRRGYVESTGTTTNSRSLGTRLPALNVDGSSQHNPSTSSVVQTTGDHRTMPQESWPNREQPEVAPPTAVTHSTSRRQSRSLPKSILVIREHNESMCHPSTRYGNNINNNNMKNHHHNNNSNNFDKKCVRFSLRLDDTRLYTALSRGGGGTVTSSASKLSSFARLPPIPAASPRRIPLTVDDLPPIVERYMLHHDKYQRRTSLLYADH